MNLEETGIVEENLFERGSRLQRFCTILNFELSTVVLFLLTYIWQVTIFLAAFAAMLFTPYLIFVLDKRKKNRLDSIFYSPGNFPFNNNYFIPFR